MNDTKRPAKSKSASPKSYEGIHRRRTSRDEGSRHGVEGSGRRRSRAAKADDESAVPAKIAEMADHYRILGERPMRSSRPVRRNSGTECPPMP